MLIHDFTLYTLLLVTHINLSYSSLFGFLVPKNLHSEQRSQSEKGIRDRTLVHLY